MTSEAPARPTSSARFLSQLDLNAPPLEVRNLHVEFHTTTGMAHAVNGMNFVLSQGETRALLGESGSGKSVTAQAIMGILDSPPARITNGEILYRGVDLLKLSDEDRRRVRANHIAMIFQDALSALNPVFTVGFQLGELYRKHRGMSRQAAKAKAVELLDMVKIPAAKDRINDFPHQFSGGMRQRVMIAMALALEPEILIADEPTTALDVTVQAQVMGLLSELQSEHNMSLILITHDMGVVADVADSISVMYAGRVVEDAPVADIYARPAHPYTKALIESIPRVDMKGQQLSVIKGLPPILTNIPPGCAFHPRCKFAQDKCKVPPEPPHYDVDVNRVSACHFWREVMSS